MVLLQLFLSFLKIGLFAIGGAYSFIPLMEKEAVQNHKWLTQAEFLEMVGMVELFPGAISIKFATYTGYKVAGLPGAIIANLANLLPPVIIMAGAAFLYGRYAGTPALQGALVMVRYAVAAMIVAIGIKLALGAKMADAGRLLDIKILPVVIGAFLLLFLTRIHPAFVIIGAAIYGIVLR